MVNTVWTSVAIAVLATAGGAAAALVTERSQAPGRRWLRWALVGSLVCAPLVSALGWARAYSGAGLTDDLLGLHWDELYGPAGVVVVGACGSSRSPTSSWPRRCPARVEPDLSAWRGRLAPDRPPSSGR